MKTTTQNNNESVAATATAGTQTKICNNNFGGVPTIRVFTQAIQTCPVHKD